MSKLAFSVPFSVISKQQANNNNWRIWCVSRFFRVNKNIKQTYKSGLQLQWSVVRINAIRILHLWFTAFWSCQSRPHNLELSRISSGTRLSVQTVSDLCLKRICSLAFQRVRVLDDNYTKILKLRWLPVAPIENLCMVCGEAVEEAFKERIKSLFRLGLSTIITIIISFLWALSSSNASPIAVFSSQQYRLLLCYRIMALRVVFVFHREIKHNWRLPENVIKVKKLIKQQGIRTQFGDVLCLQTIWDKQVVHIFFMTRNYRIGGLDPHGYALNVR